MARQSPPSSPLTAAEWKFLWQLRQSPGQRAPIATIQPTAKMKATERDRLCRQLSQKGLVAYEELITRFGLTAIGRVLLGLDTSVLPVTPDEKLILQSCQYRSIAPGQIHPRVPREQHQRLLLKLAHQKLIRITQHQIQAVWLTPAGAAVLTQTPVK